MKTSLLKNILIICMAFFVLTACSSVGKSTSQLVYEKYYNMEGFSEIVFPPQFVLKFIAEENTDQKDVIKNMDDIRILFFNDESDENQRDRKSVV